MCAESVVEHFDHGLDGRSAVTAALKHTGNIISVASEP